MGWTGYPGKTPDEALEAHLNDVTLLSRVDRPGYTWILAETTMGGGSQPIIACVIRDGNYLKDVDETMGPLHYDCPLPWLSQSPVRERTFSETWRIKVRALWALAAAIKDLGPDLGGFSPVDLLLDQDIARDTDDARRILDDLARAHGGDWR
jgi:hypothetical protein